MEAFTVLPETSEPPQKSHLDRLWSHVPKNRVARRIAVLFVACTLVPMAGFALVTVRRTSRYLERAAGDRLRAEGKTPAQRVHDYLSLLGIEGAEPVRAAIASLLPAGTGPDAVIATIRQMRRRWLELYGNDPFFAED